MSFENKYAPTDLESVVYHDDKTRNAILAYQQGLADKSLLLYGPPGTGKTTIAKLLPRAIACDVVGPDIRHLNASADRSFKEITKIKEFGRLASHNSTGIRFAILDEVDGLRSDAFDALRGVMDYLKGHCLFVLTTNYFDKIPDPIKSRCTCLPIKGASAERWLDKAVSIMKAEGYPRPPEVLMPLLKPREGDNREMLGVLEDVIRRIKQSDFDKVAACIVPQRPAA
ncbi:MAG: AAA family ATPase [Rhodospirillales bacterium]|nr:AAA family ATPase [Rhodospirillales bacterium]